MISVRTCVLAAALAAVPATFFAKTCGGNFNGWMNQLKAEAVQKGHKKAKVDTFLRTARVDPKLLKADRS